MSEKVTPLVIAHRGSAGKEPENTLIAFDKAIQGKCNVIELDVRLTADYVPVVFHDSNLERMTGKNCLLSSMTLSELQKIKINHEHPIPILEEIIEHLCRNVVLDIEIKENDSVMPTLTIIKNKKLEDRVVISSFSERAIIMSKKHCPEIKTGLIMGVRTYNPIVRFKEFFPFLPTLRCQADFTIIHHSLAPRIQLRILHAFGLKVFVWASIEEEKQINQDYFEQSLNNQVDGIATIWPGELCEILTTMKNEKG